MKVVKSFQNDGEILIINLGLRSIRAIVFNKEGKKLFHEWLPVKTKIDGDNVEQSPNEWWELTQELIKIITNNFKQIKAISVTSSASCLVILDKNGEVLGNSIMVSDKRSLKQADRLKHDQKFSFVNKKNSMLFQPSFMIPKMLWVKENKPELFYNVGCFMSSNDFLIYKLTGKIVTDYLNAEKFYYDVENKEYPQVLLQDLGIGINMLPKVMDIGNRIGYMNNKISTNCGFLYPPEVVLSTYDAICAFVGSGVDKDEANNVCGTCSSIRLYSKSEISKERGILSQYFKLNSKYIVGGSNNLEGGLLEWAKNCFYGDSYYSNEDFLHELMEKEAKTSNVGANGLLFLPYLIGERVPFFDTNVRGVFFGLERTHTRKDIIRSIFESTGFLSLSIIKSIEENDGMQIKRLRVSGGLAKNDFICKLRADITGKEVLVLEEEETTSVGAFMITSLGLGWIQNLEDLKNIVKIRKSYLPDQVAHKKYQEIFELYMSVYENLKKPFVKRNEVYSNLIKSEIINNL